MGIPATVSLQRRDRQGRSRQGQGEKGGQGEEAGGGADGGGIVAAALALAAMNSVTGAITLPEAKRVVCETLPSVLKW